MKATSPELLDQKNAAARLGVSRWTLRRLVDCGAIPVIRLPNRRGGTVRKLLFDPADLEELVNRSKEIES